MLCGRTHSSRAAVGPTTPVPTPREPEDRAAERRWTVLDPRELYQVEPDAPALREPVLVIVLDGFVEAGSAARLAVDSLLATGPGRLVARFDVDQLVDYRSRRPPLRFETDRWASYSAPELDVVALTDSGGAGYLLLSGPEPDTQWERFAAAVAQLVADL